MLVNALILTFSCAWLAKSSNGIFSYLSMAVQAVGSGFAVFALFTVYSGRVWLYMPVLGALLIAAVITIVRPILQRIGNVTAELSESQYVETLVRLVIDEPHKFVHVFPFSKDGLLYLSGRKGHTSHLSGITKRYYFPIETCHVCVVHRSLQKLEDLEPDRFSGLVETYTVEASIDRSYTWLVDIHYGNPAGDYRIGRSFLVGAELERPWCDTLGLCESASPDAPV